MALPITFSPPGDTYAPAAEDALRTGVMMLFLADNVTRKAYSYDEADSSKGVRIYAGGEAQTTGAKGNRTLVLPQLLVSSAFASGRFTYSIGSGGEKETVIIITHFESIDTSYIDTDPSAPEITPESRFARFEAILMHGTLYEAEQESQDAVIVDPYRSGKLDSGLYDPSAIVRLNGLAPEFRRAQQIVTNAVGQSIAVSFSLFATYKMDIKNRLFMTEAGFE